MSKIFDQQSEATIGKERQRYELFDTTWTYNWLKEGGWHDGMINTLAVDELLDFTVEKRQALVKDESLAILVKHIMVFYWNAIYGHYYGS